MFSGGEEKTRGEDEERPAQWPAPGPDRETEIVFQDSQRVQRGVSQKWNFAVKTTKWIEFIKLMDDVRSLEFWMWNFWIAFIKLMFSKCLLMYTVIFPFLQCIWIAIYITHLTLNSKNKWTIVVAMEEDTI